MVEGLTDGALAVAVGLVLGLRPRPPESDATNSVKRDSRRSPLHAGGGGGTPSACCTSLLLESAPIRHNNGGLPQEAPIVMAVAVGTVLGLRPRPPESDATNSVKGTPGGVPFTLAVAVGFEPTVELPPHTLSRRAPLAARTRHRPQG